MTVIQRLYGTNIQMELHRIGHEEPLVINKSEINEVAEYIFTSLRHGGMYQLEYLKMSLLDGKVMIFGRNIKVLS
jgi:hypothetical protein